MGIVPFGATLILLMVQPGAGSVGGTIRDAETGAPMSGAVVTFADLRRSVLSDSAGRYLLADVPAGRQPMSVRRVGYAVRTLYALVPRQGTLKIDVTLLPVPIRLRPIEVGADIPDLGLERGPGPSYPDRGLTMAAVRQHPLFVEPDALQALGGGGITARPEAPSGLHIRGGASDQVVYLLDGIPVLSPFHAGGTFSAWNPDALARVDVFSASAPPSAPPALSGIVAATTRTPGPTSHVQGGVSNTQLRTTLDGPIGLTGAGYLLGLRSAFPGLVAHRRERSYLEGDGGDALGKIEAPLLAGRLHLLGYGGRTEIEATARADADSESANRTRNTLDWDTRSLGARWVRNVEDGSIELRAWRATGGAAARWGTADSLQDHLRARRRDLAAAARIEWHREAAVSTAGVVYEQIRTSYRLRPDSLAAPSIALIGQTPVATLVLRHQRPLTARSDADLTLGASLSRGEIWFSPESRFRLVINQQIAVSGGFARRHQFAQSLRNPESVLATVFPADLYVGAGTGHVPVARSDLGFAAVEVRPGNGWRLGAQAYLRSFDGLVLVAPGDAGPFATAGVGTGTGDARGAALEIAGSGMRYAVLLNYGYQRLRLESGDVRYVPEQGATHSIDAGVTIFPSASSSVRLGVASLLGRRATAILGGFEWEACNLLDRGCEFLGSPGARAGPLGLTRLPAYVRLDLGFRMNRRLRVAGRDAHLAVFGSATNLLGRINVLTVAVDPSTGRRTRIEMRPRSPLVFGIDWQF